MVYWNFAKAVQENEKCKIDGINIWNHNWHCVNQKVEVKDPIEGQVYYFKEYEIKDGNKKINFVAGEFLDGKVGIYLKEQ